MAHSVRVTAEAEADLRSFAITLSRRMLRCPQSDLKRLRRRIASLKTFPEGYGLAPESQAVGVELRQMMHGVYRVLYTVESEAVTIHAVRHGARRPLRPDELGK
jgi:plasmid stabilization system protein ParE